MERFWKKWAGEYGGAGGGENRPSEYGAQAVQEC